MIDTHCHLNHARFAEDLPETLARAKTAGVDRMIVVGYDLPSSVEAVRLARLHAATLFAAVAIHPHDARSWNDAAADQLLELAQNPGVVAIGEIGLDFHYDFSPRADQYRAFRAQLHLAQRLMLPVILHCREAYPETLALLQEEEVNRFGGVMHCWGGTRAEAGIAAELGLHFGFGGTLTFKNAQETRACARMAPLERMLLETDAPYLAPVPYRGRRNEPAYTAVVADSLADLRDLPREDLIVRTTSNAARLFRISAETLAGESEPARHAAHYSDT